MLLPLQLSDIRKCNRSLYATTIRHAASSSYSHRRRAHLTKALNAFGVAADGREQQWQQQWQQQHQQRAWQQTSQVRDDALCPCNSPCL
jgi:hypothetical protein